MTAGCFICRPDNLDAAGEGCADCEESFVNQVVIPAGVVDGETAPDVWTDYGAVYAQFSQPYLGGILSSRGRYDSKVSRARLRRDSEAILWTLHWACRDIVSARSWGSGLADDNRRLRDRLTEVFGLLTTEQRDEMWRRDQDRLTTPPSKDSQPMPHKETAS